MKRQTINISERGTTTVEFAVTAAFFFTMLVVVVAGGSLFWTHNALVEATRRGARYAANQCHPTDINCPNHATTVERIKNVVLYNSTAAGTTPFVPHLQASNISVTHTNNFGFSAGTVRVKIENYQYNFPLSPVPLQMPPYQTTLAGENVGYIPPDR
jgi:Flp pilus assembly protein TadG